MEKVIINGQIVLETGIIWDGVLVVEGRERSGALISARYAKESGRRVYAVPGNVDNKNSESTNVLIKNGAIFYNLILIRPWWLQ